MDALEVIELIENSVLRNQIKNLHKENLGKEKIESRIRRVLKQHQRFEMSQVQEAVPVEEEYLQRNRKKKLK
jgi:hypothetical protein